MTKLIATGLMAAVLVLPGAAFGDNAQSLPKRKPVSTTIGGLIDRVIGTPKPKRRRKKRRAVRKATPAARPALAADQPAAPLARPPLPRPRPPAIAALARAVPGAAASGRAARALPVAPIGSDATGQIVASVPSVGRERDPKTARELQPNMASRWTSAQLAAAKRRCDLVLAATNIEVEHLSAIGGPGGCGIASPVRVKAFGAVAIKPGARLNCTMALAVYKWLTEEVQPAARKAFGEPVVAIHNAASYACRRRNNSKKGRISEHAFGNALDISSFTLASGKKVTVKGEWSTAGAFLGISSTAGFLKNVHKGACRSFATVLGPRANALHVDHFHMDLGRSGHYKYCR